MNIQIKKAYDYTQKIPQLDWGPSQTVPDQTMSLRTLVNRYANGQAINGRELQYSGEDSSGIDFKHLDLADREQFFKERHEELINLKNKIVQTNRKQKEDNDFIQSLKKDIAELKKAISTNTP